MSTENRKYELKARAQQLAETRRRIVEATAELHEEVGPAKTTIAEIARRAGVQRLTVYKHFPNDAQLLAACQQHFMSQHPPPDLTASMQIADPVERVRAVLVAMYASYRARDPMTSKVLRDRTLVPALDALLEGTVDAWQAQLVDTLSRSFRAGGRKATRLRSLIGVALDFWTWRRLRGDGLTDDEAATMMSDVLRCVAGG